MPTQRRHLLAGITAAALARPALAQPAGAEAAVVPGDAGRRAARKALDASLAFATDVRSVKFLFLPQEHDPDSFIRANGKEAFARYVSEATPLSRFLI